MRRDVGNALIRVRRDLRFLLADRYRALLSSRYVVLTALAAGVLDRGVSLIASGRALTALRAGPRTVAPGAPTVLRAAVAGGDEISLIVRAAPAGADALVLRRPGATIPLPTTLDRGSLMRLVAVLPTEDFDGDDWTVAIGAGGSWRDLQVTDPAAVAARIPSRRRRPARGAASEADTENWPPRLRIDGGRLVLCAQPPRTVGRSHTVEVGVRSAIVTWPVPAGGTTAALVLVADDDERVIPAPVADGTARASVDLGRFGTDGTWFAFAADPTVRVALALPRGTFPPLDSTGRPHRVPLPTQGPTGRAVEVGYSPDNQLVVRVGNFAPAAS